MYLAFEMYIFAEIPRRVFVCFEWTSILLWAIKWRLLWTNRTFVFNLLLHPCNNAAFYQDRSEVGFILPHLDIIFKRFFQFNNDEFNFHICMSSLEIIIFNIQYTFTSMLWFLIFLQFITISQHYVPLNEQAWKHYIIIISMTVGFSDHVMLNVWCLTFTRGLLTNKYYDLI